MDALSIVNCVSGIGRCRGETMWLVEGPGMEKRVFAVGMYAFMYVCAGMWRIAGCFPLGGSGLGLYTRYLCS